MPPAVLLSQLVEGDEEGFNLALADVLEAHRAYYQVADPCSPYGIAATWGEWLPSLPSSFLARPTHDQTSRPAGG